LLAVARDSSITGEAADLGAVCRELGDALRPRIDRLGRQLRLDIEPDVAPVRCPPQVLREIFVVLVDNAIEHGAGTIDITVRRRGAGATVSVSDDGPGVPRERAERIFARRDSSAAGNGIGLSLARSLAEAHDLRVELTRTGQAPVFTVACPGVTTPA
jgi:signal transduction histidine kinase